MITARHIIIAMEWIGGDTFQQIGLRHGISTGRAQQIKEKCFYAIRESSWTRGTIAASPKLQAEIRVKLRWLCHPDPNAMDRSTPAGVFWELMSERVNDEAIQLSRRIA